MTPLTVLADPIEHAEIGYRFEPFADPRLPGHPKLQVVIYAQPTLQHYDPESIEVPIVTSSHHLESRLIRHLAPRHETLRVCAGTIIIRDRVNKEVEVFSLGGELSIDSHFDHTVCTLISPAPIFDLLSEHSLSVLVAEEIEMLLAERRAAWAARPNLFDERLACAEPWLLFAACLKALSVRFAHHSVSIDDPDYHLIHFLRSEICLGPDGWISPSKIIPNLADLL